MVVEIALIATAGFLVVALVVTVAIVLDIRAWSHRMDERAAMREREHQEHMISLEMDARRRQREHARWMRGLDARRR